MPAIGPSAQQPPLLLGRDSSTDSTTAVITLVLLPVGGGLILIALISMVLRRYGRASAVRTSPAETDAIMSRWGWWRGYAVVPPPAQQQQQPHMSHIGASPPGSATDDEMGLLGDKRMELDGAPAPRPELETRERRLELAVAPRVVAELDSRPLVSPLPPVVVATTTAKRQSRILELDGRSLSRIRK